MAARKTGKMPKSSLSKGDQFKKGVSGKTKSMHSGNKKGPMHSKETGMKHGAKRAGHGLGKIGRGTGKGSKPQGYGF